MLNKIIKQFKKKIIRIIILRKIILKKIKTIILKKIKKKNKTMSSMMMDHGMLNSEETKLTLN